MSEFRPVAPMEAHPTHDEYVLERALRDGGWTVESIVPAPTAEQAEARHADLARMCVRHTQDAWVLDADFRVVRRTTTSTVVSVHPNVDPMRPGSENRS